MQKLRIAIQKSGKLHDGTFELLTKCGIKASKARNEFLASSLDFPSDLYLIRDDDIPEFVNQKICDVGIVGKNVLAEYELDLRQDNLQNNINVVMPLSFSKCRLSLAVRESTNYTNLGFFSGKKIATSYPLILSRFLKDNQIENVQIIRMQGSVELSTQVGIADAICDIISTGSTLTANRLKEVHKVMDSEAVLVINNQLDQQRHAILESLCTRITAVNNAKVSKYIMLHAPKDKIDEIIKLIPGCEKPTILGLHDLSNRVALHAVSSEEIFWNKLEELKAIGCSSILVLPIEKMLA